MSWRCETLPVGRAGRQVKRNPHNSVGGARMAAAFSTFLFQHVGYSVENGGNCYKSFLILLGVLPMYAYCPNFAGQFSFGYV